MDRKKMFVFDRFGHPSLADPMESIIVLTLWVLSGIEGIVSAEQGECKHEINLA